MFEATGGKKIKQWLSWMLAASIGASALFGSTAFADVLTENSSPGNENHSSNMAYQYKSNQSFNLSLLHTNASGIVGTGYVEDALHRITEGDAGFKTFYAIGKPADAYPAADPPATKAQISPDISFTVDTPSYTPKAQPLSNYNHGMVNGKVVKLKKQSSDADPSFEVMQTVYPTDDGKYLILEYMVHNLTNTAQEITVGSAANLALIDQNNASMVITAQDAVKGNGFEGIHVQANGGGTGISDPKVGGGHVFSVLDIYTDMPQNPYGLGVDVRGATDKSRTAVWLGQKDLAAYGSGGSYENAALAKYDHSGLLEDGDTAAAMSAYFDLASRETKTARFAIAAKEHVYYAHGDKDLSEALSSRGLDTGFMTSPVVKDINTSSIQRAITKAQSDNNGNNKEIYIMVQGDEEIRETIIIPSGMTVHLQSADFSSPAQRRTIEPVYHTSTTAPMRFASQAEKPEVNSTSFTLKRAVGFNRELFHVQNGGTLEISNLTIDGNKAAIAAHNASVLSNPAIMTADGFPAGGDSPADIAAANSHFHYVNRPLIENHGHLIIADKAKLKNADTSNERSLVKTKMQYTQVTSSTDPTPMVYTGYSYATITDRPYDLWDGSAIWSGGRLTLRGGEITDNVSSSSGAAVFVANNSTNDANLKNAVRVEGADKIRVEGNSSFWFQDTRKRDLATNTDKIIRTEKKPGARSNLYLRHERAYVTVAKSPKLHTQTKIGVRTPDFPDTDTKGKLLAMMEDETGTGISFDPSNFFDDKFEQTRMGTIGHTDMFRNTPEVAKRLYIKRTFIHADFNFEDENGVPLSVGSSTDGAAMSAPAQTKSVAKASGSNIHEAFSIPAGYKIKRVEVTPASVQYDLASDLSWVRLRGITTDATINVRYARVVSRYTFDKMLSYNGSTTDDNIRNVDTVTAREDLLSYEEAVSPSAPTMITVPTPSRIGYAFLGWREYKNTSALASPTTEQMDSLHKAFNARSDAANGIAGDNAADEILNPLSPPITSLSILPPNAERDKYYYAVWQQVVPTIPILKRITNNNPSVQVNFYTHSTSYPENHLVEVDLPHIPGYRHFANAASREESPAFGASSVVDHGTLNHTRYRFSGHMPSTAAGILWKYDADVNTTFTYTVNYLDENNQPIFALDGTPYSRVEQKVAEEPISADAPSIAGYTYNGVTIDTGAVPDAANYILGLNSTGFLTEFNDGSGLGPATGEFSGFMPNQNVTITYRYTDNTPSTPYRKIVVDDITHPENGITTLYADKMQTAPLLFPTASATGFHRFYGFMYSRVIHTSTTGAVVDAAGTVHSFIPGLGGTLILGAKKNALWNTLRFGFVQGDSALHAGLVPAASTLSILTSDGTDLGNSKAMRFSKIRLENGFPNAVPNSIYYMFEDWYRDEAGTQRLAAGDIFHHNPVLPHEQTIYAKIVEDPTKWIDVRFVTENPAIGTLESAAPGVTNTVYTQGAMERHIHFDATWASITKPNAIPIANYELKGWRAPDGRMVSPTDVMQPGTYTAVFGKVDATWGLNVGAFGAFGRIGKNGSGIVQVSGVTAGNTYIVLDPDGMIVGIERGVQDGMDLQFPELIPGRSYQVIEGSADTSAQIGAHQSTIAASHLSGPKTALIPSIGDNKNVGVDPTDTQMAQIVINPADADAEYALVDSAGNVVIYPDAPEGWYLPIGNGLKTVTFNHLHPGEIYTVVARKSANASETVLGNLAGGVAVTANPGDMVQAPKYIIGTKTNGIGATVEVKQVDGVDVHTPMYTEARANARFSLYADPVDAQGHAFSHWLIMNGRIPGVTARIISSEYEGTLAGGNVLFKAVYEIEHQNALGEEIAPVREVNRAMAADGEFALDPGEIYSLEKELSTPTDRSLRNINHAAVRYDIVFNKRNVKTAESILIKSIPSAVWDQHPQAYTAAWALEIKEERYVDHRLVQNATPSDAQVQVHVQLPAEDTDMLDYELWDLGAFVDSSWNAQPLSSAVQISFSEDLENNAGYLSFTGNLNHRYVLVYVKTFKLSFIDNNPSMDHLWLGDTNRNFFKRIKVRRGDTVDSILYEDDYEEVKAYADAEHAGFLKTPWEDIYGTSYTYVNWSKEDMPKAISVFDPGAQVRRSMSIFAYYTNNRAEVLAARERLERLIPVGENLLLNPYLRLGEAEELTEKILEARNILARERGRLENGTDPLRMAKYSELQGSIDALFGLIDRLNTEIMQRERQVLARTGGSSGGGTGAAGRGGGGAAGTPLDGTKERKLPLSSTLQDTFTLGSDGRWEINPYHGRWSFVLNGGLALNDKWARIDYTDADGERVTDWYRFDTQAGLQTGWYRDRESGSWFMLNPAEGKDIGKMLRGWYKDSATGLWYYLDKESGELKYGWHLDPDDGYWYYQDPKNGHMLIGWQSIGGKWYYFNPYTPESTWKNENGKWIYEHKNVRPYGAMFKNTMTPDGYPVGEDGTWKE